MAMLFSGGLRSGGSTQCNGCHGRIMQRTGRPGPKRTGQSRANGSLRCHAGLTGALALVLLSVGLTACESARSYERVSEGPTVYLDQLSDAAKAEARQKIVQNLSR